MSLAAARLRRLLPRPARTVGRQGAGIPPRPVRARFQGRAFQFLAVLLSAVLPAAARADVDYLRDPKPALNTHAGRTFDRTSFPNPLLSPRHKERFRSVPAESINVRDVYPIIYPMQVGHARHGQCGIGITDWRPHLSRCADDIAWVRNMWTTDNDHAAKNQIHTGRHRLDETQPSLGAWVHYGLGSLSENLPSYVVLGGPTAATTRDSIHAYYLGPQHAGVPLKVDPANPLAFGRRPDSVSGQRQQREVALASELLGLDGRRLEIPGRRRLEIDHGRPIREILA